MRDSAERSETFRVTEYLDVTERADPEQGDGSQASPFGSLDRAMSVAHERGGDFHVRIARGSYPVMGLVLDAHISLFGGYHESDWSRDVATHETIVRLAGDQTQPLVSIASDADETTVVDGLHFDLLTNAGDHVVIETKARPPSGTTRSPGPAQASPPSGASARSPVTPWCSATPSRSATRPAPSACTSPLTVNRSCSTT